MTVNKIETYEELKDKLKKYIKDKKQLAIIDKSYEFANEKHQNQKRVSGEPYIIHPLNVANILCDIKADSSTISAALLHDTIEDCDVTYEQIEKEFGAEIAKLVESITKINRLNFSGDTEALIANQRKILVGLTEDVRVIFLKLADRLHNMRTLWALSEKRQRANAKETLDIFTPIAHRLGMNSIKSELEDLSLRYLKPDVYFQIVEKLNKTKSQRDSYVTKMKESVSEILNAHNIKHEIKGRSKSIYSIYKKLDKGKTFNEIYDFLALRVYVDTVEQCYQVLGLIHSKYKPMPKRFKDYIAMPKTNMYQSLHTTVFGVDGMVFEIQIRTYEMDKVAENGLASHWSYKEGKSNMQNEMEQKLQFFRVLMEINNDHSSDQEFIDSVKEDVLKDSVYVFTPNGDVIELPKGSTPIDFAYRVHSKVGDTMVGAIVNNSIVPLDYELKDNDIVKINTNKNSTPSQEWISIAKTNQAKNKIKSFFNKTVKEDYANKGEDLLNKELRKRKISNSDFYIQENLNKIFSNLKIADLNELYINIGNNKFTSTQVINIITDINATKEEIILKKTQNKEVVIPNAKNDIIVEGIEDIKVNIASCCKPIYGDEIIGYITKGHGITVHSTICPNISDLQDRFIDVKWNDLISKKYPTSLLIRTLNNDNVLMEIIAKTSNSNITVESIKTISSTDDFLYEITILVESKEKLNKYINDLMMLNNILSVERLVK